MTGLFILIFFAAVILLLVGLIKPVSLKFIFRKTPTRKMVSLVFIGLALASFVAIGASVPESETTNNTDIRNETGEIVVQDNPSEDSATSTSQVTVSDENNDLSIAEVSSTPIASDQFEASAENVTESLANEDTTASQENSVEEYYTIAAVVDGDTVKINMDGAVVTLRLIGIDTPETVDPSEPVQCFGEEASNKAKELLTGQKVRIEKDSSQGDYDKYGRLLAYIYREDGLFFNKYMIEQGYAHEYTYSTAYKYQTEFKAAEKTAQDNLRGFWSPSTCDGDTTQSAESAAASDNTESTTDNSESASETADGLYYTSSYYTAKYYYPEDCDGWKSLSTKYLKSFSSLEDLLAAYPSRTLSPQCQ